jgi:hypothetical protein
MKNVEKRIVHIIAILVANHGHDVSLSNLSRGQFAKYDIFLNRKQVYHGIGNHSK